jgi:uncharacterized Fe-S cluster-containing radical SAM superfamily protein
MTNAAAPLPKPLDPRKFRDPDTTAAGERRAAVRLTALRTLWFNTGTLCNLACRNCYIESSPRNDRLAYITRGEVGAYLDEIAARGFATEQIGLTGGEPFMNPDIVAIMGDCLARGFRLLVLTNAMRPMMRLTDDLLRLKARHGPRLIIRVSLDHYSQALHELERGPRSWAPTLAGLKGLSDSGFAVHVAGRTCWGEPEERLRSGYARLFAEQAIRVDAHDAAALVLFPEMDARADVPEITVSCWGILGVSPDAMMCASSRMVVKRKGAAAPVVVPCTLLPYEAGFEMGTRLADAQGEVKLNHPHCAKFCVLGGGACSRA